MERAKQDLERVAALADPLRRAIYLYVVGKRGEVGRDEAASAFGIGRSLAAFHLDKLLDEGLLEARYRRLSGRSGPGAGRPAKMYRPTADLRVTVPHRDYELAARLLVEAAAGDPAGSIDDAAHAAGRSAGLEVRGRRPPSSAHQVRRRLKRALEERGYEPYSSRGEIRLRNCPFHALAEEHRETICPMNLSLIRGILDGLGARAAEAIPRQTRGECCVAIRVEGREGAGPHRRSR